MIQPMHEFKLKDRKPLARGVSRLVFAHPMNRELLIKVMRADFLEHRRASATFYNRLSPTWTFNLFAREVREQLILIGKGEDCDRFLARSYGFCDTDLGLGMFVRAMRGADGRLAPKLPRLIADGAFGDRMRGDLEVFCGQLDASAITLGALAPHNIVYAADPAGARHFVLIDGYGEGAILPLRGMFPHLNRIHKRRLLRRFWTDIEERLQKTAQSSVTEIRQDAFT